MKRHIKNVKSPSADDNAAYAEKLKLQAAQLADLRIVMSDRLREFAVSLTELQTSMASATKAMEEFQQYAREVNVQNE